MSDDSYLLLETEQSDLLSSLADAFTERVDGLTTNLESTQNAVKGLLFSSSQHSAALQASSQAQQESDERIAKLEDELTVLQGLEEAARDRIDSLTEQLLQQHAAEEEARLEASTQAAQQLQTLNGKLEEVATKLNSDLLRVQEQSKRDITSTSRAITERLNELADAVEKSSLEMEQQIASDIEQLAREQHATRMEHEEHFGELSRLISEMTTRHEVDAVISSLLASVDSAIASKEFNEQLTAVCERVDNALLQQSSELDTVRGACRRSRHQRGRPHCAVCYGRLSSWSKHMRGDDVFGLTSLHWVTFAS